jgi:hypothetical protein
MTKETRHNLVLLGKYYLLSAIPTTIIFYYITNKLAGSLLIGFGGMFCGALLLWWIRPLFKQGENK